MWSSGWCSTSVTTSVTHLVVSPAPMGGLDSFLAQKRHMRHVQLGTMSEDPFNRFQARDMVWTCYHLDHTERLGSHGSTKVGTRPR